MVIFKPLENLAQITHAHGTLSNHTLTVGTGIYKVYITAPRTIGLGTFDSSSPTPVENMVAPTEILMQLGTHDIVLSTHTDHFIHLDEETHFVIASTQPSCVVHYHEVDTYTPNDAGTIK